MEEWEGESMEQWLAEGYRNGQVQQSCVDLHGNREVEECRSDETENGAMGGLMIFSNT